MNSDSAGPAGGDGRGARDKGFRDRKREDHALALIEELLASLSDLARVKHILLELGRFYDPVLGGAVMGIREQKDIVEALDRGSLDRAQSLIRERYALYIKDRAHLGRPGEGRGDED
jgi:hypothetical protein